MHSYAKEKIINRWGEKISQKLKCEQIGDNKITNHCTISMFLHKLLRHSTQYPPINAIGCFRTKEVPTAYAISR